MKYYIISKIELEGTDSLKYTDVGYTEDINITNEINEQYDATLGKFLGENRTKLELEEVSISTFFNDIYHLSHFYKLTTIYIIQNSWFDYVYTSINKKFMFWFFF